MLSLASSVALVALSRETILCYQKPYRTQWRRCGGFVNNHCWPLMCYIASIGRVPMKLSIRLDAMTVAMIAMLAPISLELTAVHAGPFSDAVREQERELEQQRRAQEQERAPERAPQQAGPARPIGGACECNVYIDAPRYCPSETKDNDFECRRLYSAGEDTTSCVARSAAISKECRNSNARWLDACNKWLTANCTP